MKRNVEKITVMTMIVFIIMNFVLSMSSALFNGILDKIAIDLSIPVSQTGYLTSFYSYGAGIGVPIFLILFRKFNRTVLLKWMLLFNVIVTAGSIVAPNFTILLIMRFLMGLAGNCYGVLATASIAALSPKEKVGRNLSLLITGSASALLVGIPLTRTLSEVLSWRVVFMLLIGLMIISLVYFIFRLPNVKQDTKPLKMKYEFELFKQKKVLLVIIASMITFIGYGAFYTYLTPYLVELFPQLEGSMSMLLAIIGFSSLAGNLLGGFICDRIGFNKSLIIGTGVQVITSILIFFTQNMMMLNVILVLLWMVNGWFIGLQINTGITVVTQNKSSLMISLNTSGIQLGQAVGASITSFIIVSFNISFSVLISFVTALLVLIILIATSKESNT